MSKLNKSDAMTEVLRKAVVESGKPMLTISNETGIARASLIRFVRGDTSLRLDVADKLAAYFSLRLRTSRPEAGTKQARQAARTRKLREISATASKALASLKSSNYSEAERLLKEIEKRGSV